MPRWDKLTSPEIGEMIDGGMDLAVLPIGATEQHGGHLATGTDTFSAGTLAAHAAAEADVLVLPAIPYGCSHGHTELWPGTLSVEPETLTALILDVSRWAIRSGIKRLIYLSGHATNGPCIGSAILKLRYEQPEIRFRSVDIWTISKRVGELYFRDAEDFHANRGETSLLMHAAPDMVRPDKAEDVEDVTPGLVFQYPMPRTTPTGAVGRPSEASPEDGREMMEIIVEDLTALLQQALAEEWPRIPAATKP
ncbi:creatininase family protein [Methyloligella sp. 2.7D]|uniref:creatininase family protein n=1 Tax=unclassified Methyloligella TaxID=2625955 RepID=UPI00157E260A|nr:creatininase family protein [Methyloligella sp. GL2]QKP77940.1 creatininase family protein [Methyloligella sp. GL2]